MKHLTQLCGLFAVIALTAMSADAGKFNKKLNINDAAPSWEKLEGIDEKKYSLADFKDKDVLVVVFTCNSCIVAEIYEERLIAFAAECNKPDSKVGFIAINVNTGKADALPAMKERASKRKFGFTYLYDPSQKTATAYGAMFTPECFVLNKERKVVYMGSFDDKPGSEPKVKYVEEAVRATLAGKAAPAPETSAAAGCKIKFDKKKSDDD